MELAEFVDFGVREIEEGEIWETVKKEILAESLSARKWKNSKNEDFRFLTTPTEKGTAGEKVFELYSDFIGSSYHPLNRKGEFDVAVYINEKKITIRFEAKLATEDSNGNYQFNNIIENKNYDYVFFIGISPNDEYYEIITKQNLWNEDYMRTKYNTFGVPMKDGDEGVKLTLCSSKMKPLHTLKEGLKTLVS